MNLASGVDEVPGGLWLVAGCTTALSVSLLLLLTGGIRRFHRSQRLNVTQTATLRNALGGLDHAYYALRHGGLLGDEALSGKVGRLGSSGRVSRDDLREAMAAGGDTLPGTTVRDPLRRHHH